MNIYRAIEWFNIRKNEPYNDYFWDEDICFAKTYEIALRTSIEHMKKLYPKQQWSELKTSNEVSANKIAGFQIIEIKLLED